MHTALATLDINGPVARLTLNRPEQRNALSMELLGALHERVDELHAACARPGAGIVVCAVTGAGKSFCAGMDLKQIVGNPEGARDLLRALAELTLKIRALPCVVVGIINGAAIGGGAGLTTVCDVAITFADNKMGFPEVDLGICPAVVTPWLVSKIGLGAARGVLLSGGLISGAEAHRLGIVTHCVPTAADLPAAAEQIVARLSTGGAHALAVTKRMLNDMDKAVDATTLRCMADLSANVVNTPETQAMLRKKAGA